MNSLILAMRRFLIVWCCLLVGVSCNKEKKYSNIPKLSYKGMDRNSIKAGDTGAVRIFIQFEDGDGNIGFGTENLFFKDSRDTQIIPFVIPKVDSRYEPENGLEGIIQIDYQSAFLLLRNDTLHKENDTLFWEIYMKDEAGNESNRILTDYLYLRK